MGQLAGSLAGGPTASVNPSSSASSGPQAGTTGGLVLNFGGINLGSQDIPLTQSDNQATNQPPTIGTVPKGVYGGAGSATQALNQSGILLPLLILAGLLLFLYEEKK